MTIIANASEVLWFSIILQRLICHETTVVLEINGCVWGRDNMTGNTATVI